jgi:hypothetical protein
VRETNMGRGADLDGKRDGDGGKKMEIGREMDWDGDGEGYRYVLCMENDTLYLRVL